MIAKAFSDNDNACVTVARIQDDDSTLPDWEAKDVAEYKARQWETAWSNDEF